MDMITIVHVHIVTKYFFTISKKSRKDYIAKKSDDIKNEISYKVTPKKYENKSEVCEYVEENKDKVVEKLNEILPKEHPQDFNSFSGIIGSKNKAYNVKPENCGSAQEYIEKWLKAHNNKYIEEKIYGLEKSSVRIKKLLDDEFVFEYIRYFLARTYHRKKE